MTRRKRRNYSPEFKAKVAIVALNGDRALAEFAQQFDVHPNQIAAGKPRRMKSALSTAPAAYGLNGPSEPSLWNLVVRHVHCW